MLCHQSQYSQMLPSVLVIVHCPDEILTSFIISELIYCDIMSFCRKILNYKPIYLSCSGTDRNKCHTFIYIWQIVIFDALMTVGNGACRALTNQLSRCKSGYFCCYKHIPITHQYSNKFRRCFANLVKQFVGEFAQKKTELRLLRSKECSDLVFHGFLFLP